MLDQKLAQFVAPTLEDLGGSRDVAQAGEALAQSLYADRLVWAIAGDSNHMPADLAKVAFAVLAYNPHSFVLAAAAQHLSHAQMGSDQTRQAQRILIARAQMKYTPAEALIASEALAGAFLLASNPGASRPALLAALDEIEADDDPNLVRRTARLAGLAWLWSRSPDLIELLKRLSSNDEVGEQALHELGLILLEDALALPSGEEVIKGLEVAADMFASASRADPELNEARALYHSLKAVSLFCTAGEKQAVELEIDQARKAAIDRHSMLDTASLRNWLRPTIAVEIAWYELANLLEGLSQRLQERSWLRAVPVLQQLCKLRVALVAVANDTGDTLREAVTHRISQGIVAQDGLHSHLSAWVNDPGISAHEKEGALALLAQVEEKRRRSLGKGEGRAEGATSARPSLDGTALLFASTQTAGSALTGKLEETFVKLDHALQMHADYNGDFSRDIRIILNYLVLYLAHCLNVTPKMGGDLFSFLFDGEKDKPLEAALQQSFWTYLCFQANGFPSHQIIREAPDIGTGRADIAIVRPSWRIVIEIKRETRNASVKGIGKYLGQACTYVLTDQRIAFLIVLDLCSQKTWPLTIEDNCWIEWVQGPGDSQPRAIVVFRIPGMRAPPSGMRTPAEAK